MKEINKKILVPVLSATALVVKYMVGYEIPDAAIDLTSDLIMGGITLLGIFMNPKKGTSQANAIAAAPVMASAIQESAAAAQNVTIKQVTDRPMSFNEVLPYLEGISSDLTTVFDALKSGKYNADTQKALDTAIAIHDFLKQQKGA